MRVSIVRFGVSRLRWRWARGQRVRVAGAIASPDRVSCYDSLRLEATLGRPVRFGFPDSYVASAFRSFSGSVTYCRRIETRTRLKLLRPARPPVPPVELRHASALWRGVVPGSARADRCEQRGGGRVTVMVRSHWWESRGYPELRPGVRTQRQQRRARPRGPSAHPVTPARTRRGDEPTGFTGTRRQRAPPRAKRRTAVFRSSV